MGCNCGKKSDHHDLEIPRGGTFSEVYAWRDPSGLPINLTGYTAEMQIRRVVDWALVLDVDAIAGALTIPSPVTGVVEISIPPASTATLPYGEALKYDLKLTSSGGEVDRVMSGNVFVSREVTT